MQNDPIGILIIIVAIVLILVLRGKIKNSSDETLQTLVKVGDFFILIRSIIAIIILSFMVYILAKVRK